MKPLLAVAFLAAAGTAEAATVTYDFTATYVSTAESGAPVAPDFFDGTVARLAEGFATLSGTLTFDTNLFSAGPPAIYSPYIVAVDQFVLPSLFQRLTIVIDGATDTVQSGGPFPSSGSGLSQLVDFQFQDQDGTAISAATPFPDLDTPDWDTLSLFFSSEYHSLTGSFSRVSATFAITSLELAEEPAPIPLPAGAGLLAAALGLLGVLRGRGPHRSVV